MLAELTKGLGMKRKSLCSKNTTVCQNGPYQKCMMLVCYIFIASYINKYTVEKCLYTVYKCIQYYIQSVPGGRGKTSGECSLG